MLQAARFARALRSLAHFAHSLARGTVDDWMAILSVFFPIFDHSELASLNLVTRELTSANSRTRERLLASVYLQRYSYMTLLAQVLVFFDFI